jgi:DNA-directed RNA polymerase subunit beta'
LAAHRNFEVDGTEEAKAERYPNRIWSDASYDAADLDSQELSLTLADPFALDEN